MGQIVANEKQRSKAPPRRKWVTLYKYVPLKYVEDILDNHRLYLNNGETFNDPFEVTVTDRKSGAINHLSGLHILSLTNSYRNKLIWSHYSDSHKSVCLTVRVPNHLVYPMCYTSRRVYSDSDIDALIEKSVKRSKKNITNPFSLLTEKKKVVYLKDKKWLYEKEFRIVFDENDESGLINEDGKWYMSVKINNVYLGVNFDKNDAAQKEKILDACKRNKVQVKQMVLSDSDYSIRVKR